MKIKKIFVICVFMSIPCFADIIQPDDTATFASTPDEIQPDDTSDTSDFAEASVSAEAFSDANASSDAEAMPGASDFATASVSAEATPDTAPDKDGQQEGAKSLVQRATEGTEYKKEWEAIKKRVEDLDAQEADVLSKLRELDDQIDQAVDEMVNARTINVDMLQAEDEAAANESLNKLKDSLKKVQDIQKSIQDKYIQPVTDSLNKIKTEMKDVQTQTSDLEKKGTILEPELLIPEADPDAAQKILQRKQIIKEAKDASPAEKKSKLYTSTVNVFAYVVEFFETIGDWLLEICGTIGTWLNKLFGRDPKTSKVEVGPAPDLSGVAEQSEAKTDVKKKNDTSTLDEQKPKWRVIVEALFGQLLDLLTFLFSKIKLYATRFYNNFLKVKLGNFFSAVQERADELEKEDEAKEQVISQDAATMPGADDIGAPHDLPPTPSDTGGTPPTAPAT